jgi:hypothetical protein
VESEPNLLMGMIGGGVAMLVSAVIWGLITYITEYQISWMAIGVGFLVGLAVRFFGRGDSMLYGVIGALLSLGGCLLGNLFFYAGVLAQTQGASLLEALFYLADPAVLADVFVAAFHPMDLLFYGLALYVGFSSSMDRGVRRA